MNLDELARDLFDRMRNGIDDELTNAGPIRLVADCTRSDAEEAFGGLEGHHG